ncbi:lytic transglycosylase domain-containing protein [Paraburkholderia sp. A1RI-2L]|uniref:lytic transglycosylase domain-containing protein n=1 Tax=Paraburkholderia sp. A1RI-2L TaxID=3028367 RepID=UPI003BA1EA9F
MKALAKTDDGFYPLGVSGIWHGGVHFDRNTAAMLKQDEGVRAIADGEVVAYRLDSKYPEQIWRDNRKALYSTGFVLIRHRLPLPPAPGVTGKPASDETLTFFSLYMHLMDWNSYQAAKKQPDPAIPHLEPMPFWEGERYYRVGDRSNDMQTLPKPKPPQPVPVDIANRDLLGEFIDADFVVPPQPPVVQPVDNTPPPVPVKGIHIRDLANGRIIGILPRGAELLLSESDPRHPGWRKIKALRSGGPVAPVAGQRVSEHARWSWVYAKELDEVLDPKPLDTVVVLKQPYPVKAGDVVGQMGHYVRYTEAKLLPPKPTRPLLHLEVFAGPELPAFIEKSRARAKALPAAKTFLEISPGARLVMEIPEPDRTLPQSAGGLKLVPVGKAEGSRWVRVQPKTVTMPARGGHRGQRPTPTLTNAGSPVWVEAQLANTTATGIVKGWSDFPLNISNAKGPGADFRDVFRRTDLDRLGAGNVAVDDKGLRWWNITIGTKDGSTLQGWVCEAHHPLARLCGPWDWPGFELIDNISFRPVDLFKRHLHVTDQYLADEDKTAFEPSALKVNAGDLIVRLEKAIDTNHDGKVTAYELQQARETPWMAEAITHLVVRSETEWGGGMGKWEEMSPLMKNLMWLWQSEIERIGKLQWWEQVASVEGFPQEPTPWHFHPVGVVGNFLQRCQNGCIHYDVMYAPRGPAYRDEQIRSYSHYNVPIDNSPGRLAGNSRRHGDANKEVQKGVIDLIVDAAKAHGLDRNDTVMVLAMARVESGFNPDAAAGTTSASGVGQFVDLTARPYRIVTDAQRFDAKIGADALVRHYLENKQLAKNYLGRELYVMIHAYQHDGPSLAYGGRGISESHVMPFF